MLENNECNIKNRNITLNTDILLNFDKYDKLLIDGCDLKFKDFIILGKNKEFIINNSKLTGNDFYIEVANLEIINSNITSYNNDKEYSRSYNCFNIFGNCKDYNGKIHYNKLNADLIIKEENINYEAYKKIDKTGYFNNWTNVYGGGLIILNLYKIFSSGSYFNVNPYINESNKVKKKDYLKYSANSGIIILKTKETDIKNTNFNLESKIFEFYNNSSSGSGIFFVLNDDKNIINDIKHSVTFSSSENSMGGLFLIKTNNEYFLEFKSCTRPTKDLLLILNENFIGTNTISFENFNINNNILNFNIKNLNLLNSSLFFINNSTINSEKIILDSSLIDATNTINFKSNNLELLNNSKIIGKLIDINTTNLIIKDYSLISANKRGFLPSYNYIYESLKKCGIKGGNNYGLGKINNYYLDKECYKSIFNYNYYHHGGFYINKYYNCTRNEYGRSGGNIIIKSKKIGLFGKIESKGSDAVNTKYLISGGSGGNITINYEEFNIEKSSLISVIGGNYTHSIGYGGGGKITLNNIMNKTNYLDPKFFELKLFDSNLKYEKNMLRLSNGIIEIKNNCLKNQEGRFCKTCKVNYYKTGNNNAKCYKCPFKMDKYDNKESLTSIKDCFKFKKSEGYFSKYIIYLVILVFIIIIFIYRYLQYKISNILNDKYIINSESISEVTNKIIVLGNNKEYTPFKLKENYTIQFLDQNWFKKFIIKFNYIFSYSIICKIFLGIVKIFFYIPFYFLFLNLFQYLKLKKLNKLINQIFYNNKCINIDDIYIGIYLSQNHSSLKIYFYKKNKKKNNIIEFNDHEIKFPFILDIIGNGNFLTPFKISFTDPIMIVHLKYLKRLLKNEILKEDTELIQSKYITSKIKLKIGNYFEIYFSYLSLLLCNVLINIPKYKYISKIQFLINIIDINNKEIFSKYDIKMNLIFSINIENEEYPINLMLLNSKYDNQILKLIYKINRVNKMEYKYYLKITKSPKKTNLFDNMFYNKMIKNSILNDFNVEFNDNIKNKINNENLKNFQNFKKIKKVFDIKKITNWDRFKKNTNMLYWKLLSYHDLKNYYNMINMITFTLIIINFLSFYDGENSFYNLFINFDMIYILPLSEIINLLTILIILLSNWNLKVMKYFIISCIMNLFKYLILTIIVYLSFNKKDNFNYLLFYILRMLIYGIISFFQCYLISYKIFKLNWKKLKQ